MEMFDEFLQICKGLNTVGIVPTLMGSLGLEYVSNVKWAPSDIDIHVPGDPRGLEAPDDRRIYDWDNIVDVMRHLGYEPVDLHKHEFRKQDLRVEFGAIDSLADFADIKIEELKTQEINGIRFRVPNPKQFLAIYQASSKDSYRNEQNNDKDFAKIHWLEQFLKYPDSKTAEAELQLAEKLYPGLWVAHSQHVGNAARLIAEHCAGMDAQKAYVCGLLHDIGRREGKSALRHIIDGYDYMMARGWDEVARVCLTHSYPVKDADKGIGEQDITAKQDRFIRNYLEEIEYNDYDKLIILCDAIADARGYCMLEKRLIDTTRRYGMTPFTVERWNKTFEYKEYFETLVGTSIYKLLPGIENSIYD